MKKTSARDAFNVDVVSKVPVKWNNKICYIPWAAKTHNGGSEYQVEG